MTTRMMLGAVAVGLSVFAAAPADAQLGGRLSLEPFVGYGFFGDLPDDSPDLGGGVTYGGRVGYRLATQWAAYGSFQRSNPEFTGGSGVNLRIDHWSVGAEFSYVPRGGAEGMLPILLEAGLGQARYENAGSDFAVNLGVASAIEMAENIRLRYGVNDYISNYGDDEGIVNQIFARVGVEISL